MDNFPLPEQPSAGIPFGKAVLVNFGILILLLIAVANGFRPWGLQYDELYMVLTGVNLVLGFVLMLFPAVAHIGKAMLGSAFVIPVIGYGLCVASFAF